MTALEAGQIRLYLETLARKSASEEEREDARIELRRLIIVKLAEEREIVKVAEALLK